MKTNETLTKEWETKIEIKRIKTELKNITYDKLWLKDWIENKKNIKWERKKRIRTKIKIQKIKRMNIYFLVKEVEKKREKRPQEQQFIDKYYSLRKRTQWHFQYHNGKGNFSYCEAPHASFKKQGWHPLAGMKRTIITNFLNF